jgi:hypothetical protein
MHDMANVTQDMVRVYVDMENVSLDMEHVSYSMACAKTPGHGKCQLWYGNVYLDMIKVAQDVLYHNMRDI